jgi:hypothetical protein
VTRRRQRQHQANARAVQVDLALLVVLRAGAAQRDAGEAGTTITNAVTGIDCA